jgi:hypothetical protein
MRTARQPNTSSSMPNEVATKPVTNIRVKRAFLGL